MPSYRKSTIPSQARKVFQGKIFGVHQWQQEMFDGSKETFEKLDRPDTADVIAITKDKKIVLTHQQQPGSELLYCIPGGRIDGGEDPLTSAKRELLEETGYGGGTWDLYKSFTPFQKIDWVLYTYIAIGVSVIGDTHHEAGEKIEVVQVSFDQYMAIMASEKCRDEHLALHLLRLQKDPVKFNAFRQRLGL